jgi:hypothetical protein
MNKQRNQIPDDDFDIPMLEEIVFPTNEMTEKPKPKKANTEKKLSPQLSAKETKKIQKVIAKQIHGMLEEVVSKAVAKTLKESIEIIGEDIKDIVIANIEPEIEKIIAKSLSMNKQ